MAIATQKEIKLRRPTELDMAAVRRVARITWDATYTASVSATNRERIVAMSYSDEALRRAFRLDGHHQWFWVAEDTSSQIVGFAEAIVRRGATDAELTRIYILPQWQKQGIGAALTEALMADLRSLPPGLRPPRLYLSVADHNRSAITFYEQRGFQYSRNFQANLPGQWLDMREYLIEV